MELLTILWNFIDNQFRPILVITSSVLALYFTSKKFGNNISVIYTILTENSSHTRISNLIFQNKKDKPISIYKVIAVFDQKYSLEIKTCSPPLILKPYESISVEADPFSHLSIDGNRYSPDFMNADIYIESGSKLIKCNSKTNTNFSYKYVQIVKSVKKFNNIVYNDNISYILVYEMNNIQKTAFISHSGFFTKEWDFSYNKIKSTSDTLKPEEIYLFLNQHFSKIIDSYLLYVVDKKNPNPSFLKHHNLKNKDQIQK